MVGEADIVTDSPEDGDYIILSSTPDSLPQPNNNLNNNLLQYIDDKFYETLNKIIKSEVASCVKSQLTNYNLLSETEPTNYKTHANEDNDCLKEGRWIF